MKVSFDFDGTLSKPIVQEYAKELLKRGIDVWICTSRFDLDKMPNKEWNDDLLEVASSLPILHSKIIFTNYANKSEFLKDKGFVFHLDDDNIELSFIKTDTDVEPIHLFGNKNWKMDCEETLISKLKP